MANLIEGGKTPLLGAAAARGDRLQDRGVSADAAECLDSGDAGGAAQPEGRRTAADIMDFEQLKQAVGFPAYYAEEARYKVK